MQVEGWSAVSIPSLCAVSAQPSCPSSSCRPGHSRSPEHSPMALHQGLISPLSMGQTWLCQVLACRALWPGLQSALLQPRRLQNLQTITSYSCGILDVLANSSCRQTVLAVRQRPYQLSSKQAAVCFSADTTRSPWGFLHTTHHLKTRSKPHRSPRSDWLWSHCDLFLLAKINANIIQVFTNNISFTKRKSRGHSFVSQFILLQQIKYEAKFQEISQSYAQNVWEQEKSCSSLLLVGTRVKNAPSTHTIVNEWAPFFHYRDGNVSFMVPEQEEGDRKLEVHHNKAYFWSEL